MTLNYYSFYLADIILYLSFCVHKKIGTEEDVLYKYVYTRECVHHLLCRYKLGLWIMLSSMITKTL